MKHGEVIQESQFPALYQSADSSSLAGQRRFLSATRFRLVGLVTAALLGALSLKLGETDVVAILSIVPFVISFMAEIYLLRARPDRQWYEGRAAAESAKTLAWRYMVGGNPFGRTLPGEEADEALLSRLREVLDDLRVPITAPEDSAQISEEMRHVRALTLEMRREVYREGRIVDQQSWYARKGRWNETRASRWSLAIVCLEGLGIIGALLKVSGILEVELMGVLAAAAAASVAWLQAKQHQNLASAYGIAANELALILSRINLIASEAEWARFVDEAEEAISREHTLWRASHSAP